jgi:hypothetical protein
MCDFGLALTAASTLLGAAGAKQQSDASASAARYEAKVQDMNVTLSEQRARDALERGKVEEQQKREQVAQMQSKQRAAMAANGIDVGYGSALDIMVDTATLGEIDALTIRKNSANEAYDYRVDAANGRASASLRRANAANTEAAGNLNAFSTILTGAGKAYGSGSQKGYW